jgi:hypothetical protein
MFKITIDERQLFVAVLKIIKDSGLRKSPPDDDLLQRLWHYSCSAHDALRIDPEASQIEDKELQVLAERVHKDFDEAFKRLRDSELRDFVDTSDYEEL